MKIECDVIRDILPLYVEELASEKTREIVEDHLKECSHCREILEHMKLRNPQVEYKKNPAQSFQKYAKKEKKKLEIKVAIITTIIVLLIVMVRLVIVGGLVAFLALDGEKAQVWEDSQINHYSWYMGESAKEEYISKWSMDESILPEKIKNEMNVLDYKMVYYNPWDEQYLSYLVVEYEEADYAAEQLRLKEYESTPYEGYFGAEGFAEGYTLLAMEADPDFGLVYALGAKNNRIIYVEMIFCNYFMDIDYKKMINENYLPVGFDATEDSPYRKQRLGYEAGISEDKGISKTEEDDRKIVVQYVKKDDIYKTGLV